MGYAVILNYFVLFCEVASLLFVRLSLLKLTEISPYSVFAVIVLGKRF